MKSLKEQLKDRPPVSDKWEEVKDYMATHLWGKPPERIFRYRRPLESTSEFALEYRLDNFQPITKQAFNIAVTGIVETAGHIYVDIKGMNDDTKEYVNETRIKVAGKNYTLHEYIIHYITRMVEGDPNSVLVTLPLHPSETLQPDYREELPNFNTVQNEFVDIRVELISSDLIHSVTADELIYKGGEWLWKSDKDGDHYEPYYWMMTKEQTSLIIPYQSDKTYEYRIEPWYQNDLEEVPFDVIGNSAVLEEIDEEWVEYHESTFSGAVAIGNELLGVKSDEQVCTTRFVYPEKFMQMERCGFPGCVKNNDISSKYAGIYVNYDVNGDCSTCSSCSGTGMVSPDSSPLGTHWVAKSDLFTDDGRFVPPVTFITPPLESPAFLNQKVREDFQSMERALFIMSQNMTNQSGESKGYDVRQKVTILSGAVRNVYSIMEHLLNSIQGFLKGGDEKIVITLPPDFQIKSSEDITMELGNSQDTSSVYQQQLTRELLLKKFGNTSKNRKIVDFLELNDKLYGKNMDEIMKVKALYGGDLTTRDQIKHDKGWAVLQKIASENDIVTMSDQRLTQLFDEEINNVMGLEPSIEEIVDDPLLQLEAEAKSKLKGTVGGVQGIIQINAAVAAGEMSEASAQVLLQQIYGFSPEIADSLIETVQPLTPESPIV